MLEPRQFSRTDKYPLTKVGEFSLFGFRYGEPPADGGWLVTIWVTDRDPILHCWIEHLEIYGCRLRIDVNSQVDILGVMAFPSPQWGEAVRIAIKQWETHGDPGIG